MMSFDAPSMPSPLTLRECTRPRFDGNLDKLNEWLSGLRHAGVRQAGPALMMALENLRKSDLTANRRISILSALKVPILKTCAGLPKPYSEEGQETRLPSGITLEQRLYRLMFVNLDQALRQLDHQYCSLTPRQRRKRDWMGRNLFRFASRQIRYSALWKAAPPEGTWRDLHEIYYYLNTRRAHNVWDRDSATDGTAFDQHLEYKRLLLLGLAAQMKESVLRSEYFLDGLDGWAVQTQLTDPLSMLGRIRLFLVEIAEDRPPRQLEGTLESSFHGWVLQPPYPFIHELEDSGYRVGGLGFQPLDLDYFG